MCHAEIYTQYVIDLKIKEGQCCSNYCRSVVVAVSIVETIYSKTASLFVIYELYHMQGTTRQYLLADNTKTNTSSGSSLN